MSRYCGADGKWVDEGPKRAALDQRTQQSLKGARLQPGNGEPAKNDSGQEGRRRRCETCSRLISVGRVCADCRSVMRQGVA
jgi:hypothetical protein